MAYLILFSRILCKGGKMSLSKEIVIDQIEVLESNCIQVRQATKIMEDGKELSKSYHRHCLSPGDDLTNEDPKVAVIAEAVWTPEVIAAYKAMLAAQKT